MQPEFYLVHTLLILSFGLHRCTADYRQEADDFINNLVSKYDYTLEKHTVTTEDGYLLTVHHVIYKYAQTNTTKRAVLLSNGIQLTAIDFFIMGPEQSLGFLLAKANLDVWLINARGTVFSRAHVTLDPDKDEEKFFNFSFHELGIYDLSAVIDYILDYTELDQISYAGGSQGTSSFFALCTERPEYQNKIDIFLATCPVANLHYINNNVIKLLARLSDPIEVLAKMWKVYDFLGPTTFLKKLQLKLCLNKPIGEFICWLVIQQLAGYDPIQFQLSLIKTISPYFPAGGSLKQIVHYGQLVRSKEFRKFDYGPKRNLELYQQKVPPIYNLSTIQLPVIIYYGSNDKLATYKNVMYIAKRLPHLRKMQKPKWRLFNHIDFVWAKDIYKLATHDMVQDLVNI